MKPENEDLLSKSQERMGKDMKSTRILKVNDPVWKWNESSGAKW